jgi:CheY-like chemotaxis protein
MSGNITVESTPGHGARFTVTVPVQVLEPSEASGTAQAARLPQPPSRATIVATSQLGTKSCGITSSEPSASTVLPNAGTRAASSAPRALLCPRPDGRRTRVLLADDHQLNTRLCKRLLELQGGLEVITADDGDVALQMLIDSYAPGGKPVQFVLMDLQVSVRAPPPPWCALLDAGSLPCLPDTCTPLGGPVPFGLACARRCRAWTASAPRGASERGRRRTCRSRSTFTSSRSQRTCTRRRRRSALRRGSTVRVVRRFLPASGWADPSRACQASWPSR